MHGPALALACVLAAPAVRAAELTDLGSPFKDKPYPVDFDLSVGYQRTLRQAAVQRELSDAATGTLRMVKDLRYSQVRHVLPVRAELALLYTLRLRAELPIVLRDTRQLEFALDGGRACTFASDEVDRNPAINCINQYNSRTAIDGLLPGISPTADEAFAGRTVAGPEIPADVPGGPTGLHLPARSGVDQLHLGLDWAVVHQALDDTKPTWLLGFEWRVPVGTVMSYDPQDPEANTAVGRGVHELVAFTSVSRRFQHLEPFVKFWYLLPVAKSDSLFKDYGGGMDAVRPQQQAGSEFGLEIVPWNPEPSRKFAIELGAHVSAAFEGRAYTEMWEAFAGNPILDGPCWPEDWPEDPKDAPTWANCDLAPGETAPASDAARAGRAYPNGLLRHPGVTDVENYATMGARLAFHGQLSEYARLRLGLGLAHDLGHFITFTDAGRDIRSLGENRPNGRVDAADGEEVHPLYRPLIDSVGRRYRVEETTVFDLFVAGELLF